MNLEQWEARPWLWALEDWRVSSVIGGAIWLYRRGTPSASPVFVPTVQSSLLPGDAVINLQTRALGVIVAQADGGWQVRSDCELAVWPNAEICVH